jgi:hypothetical protein
MNLLKFPESTDEFIIKQLSKKITNTKNARALLVTLFEFYDQLEEVSQVDANIHYHLFNALEWMDYGESVDIVQED